MLTRVRYNGMNYVAKDHYSNGFVSVSGKRVHGEPFDVVGPQFCHVCCIRPATGLRIQEDTLYRPITEASKTEITLSRCLCDVCAKLDRLPLKCKCGSAAVLSIGAKVYLDGQEYWFRDQVCEACHESWYSRREQFLRESLVLVRPVAYNAAGTQLV